MDIKGTGRIGFNAFASVLKINDAADEDAFANTIVRVRAACPDASARRH